MKKFSSFLVGAIFLAGLYFLAQRPEIRGLFEERKTQGDPLAFLEDLPELSQKTKPENPASRKKQRMEGQNSSTLSAGVPMEESGPSPEDYNQVPNEELRRVLLQILAAKKLVEGISLSVTDRHVTVTGEVESSEKKKQILDVIEKGREARSIDTTDLLIRN